MSLKCTLPAGGLTRLACSQQADDQRPGAAYNAPAVPPAATVHAGGLLPRIAGLLTARGASDAMPSPLLAADAAADRMLAAVEHCAERRMRKL